MLRLENFSAVGGQEGWILWTVETTFPTLTSFLFPQVSTSGLSWHSVYGCSFFLIPQSINGWICLSLDSQLLWQLRLLPLGEVFPKIGGAWSHLPAPWDQPLSLRQSLKPGTLGLLGWAILTSRVLSHSYPSACRWHAHSGGTAWMFLSQQTFLFLS